MTHRLPVRSLLASAAVVAAAGALPVQAAVRARPAPLQAFRRPARASDAWPGGADIPRVRASRLVATLATATGTWKLYLLAAAGETCLELYGSGGDCNTGRDFFAGAPFEVIEAGGIVGALVPNRVVRLLLETNSLQLPVPLTPDKGTLFACPGAASCRGSTLIALDGRGRVVFDLPL